MSNTPRNDNKQPSGTPGSSTNWGGGLPKSDRSSMPSQSVSAAYGSSKSLPSLSGRSKKVKATSSSKAGSLKRAESFPAGKLPAYMDDKLLKQVRENTSKFIQQRIASVEKHFGDMCQGLGNYHRRLCKIRDTGDELSRHMYTYADKESFNSTTKESLMRFASYFSAIQDYRDVEVRRLDNKVLAPLTEYGTDCKHAKEKLKQAFAARNKELKEQKILLKLKTNTSDRSNLVSFVDRLMSHAEVDVQKASIEATRASKQLENEMEVFERQKLEDIKKIFLDFVQIEMVFHARALELYTECYQSLNSISVDDDLQEFRSSLRPPSSSQTRFGNMPGGSRTSLNTTGISNTQSTPTATPAGQRKPAREVPEGGDTMNTTTRSSMYTDTQEDDEYSEDDDDDDEESEEEETCSSKRHPIRK
ncbi:hypothetical protein LSH36_595g02012 [Paralvinella palmiformis]|uniref:Uncharacterized protein n=1 Tax=Paralvinella palmiformis TaxID=53620 RepID=A0AAD9J4Q5_9ANNE|nr:hypothetical protein LSH36_595g02012 [Paralvinella palmiformis]